MSIRVGTRKSPLAQAQTDRVIAHFPPGTCDKLLIESAGDIDATSPLHKMERPGAFTSVLTDAILDGRIDAAVHSLKDLPLEAPADAPIVAMLRRDDAADVLVLRDDARDDARPFGLRAGALVGTSAPRRQTQLLSRDPELVAVDVRGNVGTRLRLVETGVVDGLLMAAAAFERMTLPLPPATSTRRLAPREFPTGPGQGSIAIQARRDSEAARRFATLDDAATRAAVTLERELLAAIGGGCGLPLGAHAFPEENPNAGARADGGTSANAGDWRLIATLARGDWAAARTPAVHRADVRGPRETLVKRALEALTQTPAIVRTHEPATRDLVLTLDAASSQPYAELAATRGWRVHSWPLIEPAPTDAPLPSGASAARWVAVTSARAVAAARRFHDLHPGAALRVAAVGAATVRALRAAGLPAHVVSRDGTGAGLAHAIARFPAPPAPVLVAQAARPAGGLLETLAELGFPTFPWPVYDTRTVAAAPRLAAELPCDAIAFTSPSHVAAFIALGFDATAAQRFVAIGPTTARAMREASLPVDAEAARPTPGALLETLS